MRTSTNLATFGLLLALSACRDPLPCSDCEAADEETVPDLPTDTPDLPCGGVDLSSDPDNCGECGRMCRTGEWAGTEWDTGACVQGECVPTWGYCAPQGDNPTATCAEWCLVNDGEPPCVPNGCAGHTAILFSTNPFDAECWPDGNPIAEFDGSCDEPIPLPPVEEGLGVMVQCCCAPSPSP